MIAYFLKRLLLFIPVLFLISLLVFTLSKYSSGQPELNKLERESKRSGQDNLQALMQLKRELKLDLPNFYFAIHRKTACPYPNSYPSPDIVANLESLAYQLGSWQSAEDYYLELQNLSLKSSLSKEAQLILQKAYNQKELNAIKQLLATSNSRELEPLKNLLKHLELVNFSWNNFLPKFNWHGVNNQFHHWFFNLLQGDFGSSYVDGSSVKERVTLSLYWTLIISLLTLLLAFAIAIPTAVYSAANAGSKWEKIISLLFFGFYALPVFWIGTLAVVFLCGGDFLTIFPPYGLGQIEEGMSGFEILGIRFAHLILPILCGTYASLAFIHRQLRSSMIKQLSSDYAKAAIAKGISQKQLLWKHAFKNASFPLLTILGNALPYVVSGSFVIEYIFAIPGIGKLTIDSFVARDFPILFTVILLVAVVTLLGAWLADIAYHLVDPRFKINSSKDA